MVVGGAGAAGCNGNLYYGNCDRLSRHGRDHFRFAEFEQLHDYSWQDARNCFNDSYLDYGNCHIHTTAGAVMACPCCNPCRCTSKCSAPYGTIDAVHSTVGCGNATATRTQSKSFSPLFASLPRNGVFLKSGYVPDGCNFILVEDTAVGHECWLCPQESNVPFFSGIVCTRYTAFALKCSGATSAQLENVTGSALTGQLSQTLVYSADAVIAGNYANCFLQNVFECPPFLPDPTPNCLP